LTEVRGIGILRTSPLKNSTKFGPNLVTPPFQNHCRFIGARR
jgi:hypothetical protein